MTVLVVEDDEIILDSLRYSLVQAGYTVTAAGRLWPSWTPGRPLICACWTSVCRMEAASRSAMPSGPRAAFPSSF